MSRRPGDMTRAHVHRAHCPITVARIAGKATRDQDKGQEKQARESTDYTRRVVHGLNVKATLRAAKGLQLSLVNPPNKAQNRRRRQCIVERHRA